MRAINNPRLSGSSCRLCIMKGGSPAQRQHARRMPSQPPPPSQTGVLGKPHEWWPPRNRLLQRGFPCCQWSRQLGSSQWSSDGPCKGALASSYLTLWPLLCSSRRLGWSTTHLATGSPMRSRRIGPCHTTAASAAYTRPPRPQPLTLLCLATKRTLRPQRSTTWAASSILRKRN